MKKIKRNKNVLKVTLGLAAVALGTVGFSSWIISGKNLTGAASNVTVSADKVLDKRITMTISDADNGDVADTNWKLAFGPSLKTGKRITADTINEDLKLQFKITFALQDKDQQGLTVASILNDYDLKINCKTATSDGADANFNNACSTGKMIVPPVALGGGDVALETGGQISVNKGTESKGVLVYTVDLAFKWGSAFNNQNPIVYFNQDVKCADGVDPTDINLAKTALQTLAKVNEAKINYTVSLTQKAAQ